MLKPEVQKIFFLITISYRKKNFFSGERAGQLQI